MSGAFENIDIGLFNSPTPAVAAVVDVVVAVRMMTQRCCENRLD